VANIETHLPAQAIFAWISDRHAEIAAARKQRRDYREMLASLQSFTDSELRDIGISRLCLREIVHEAIYGR